MMRPMKDSKIELRAAMPDQKLPAMVRVLGRDQRQVLMKKMKSLKNCKTCHVENQFGFVYITGTGNVVNGITVQCPKCTQGACWIFDPIDSLHLAEMPLPKEVPDDV